MSASFHFPPQFYTAEIICPLQNTISILFFSPDATCKLSRGFRSIPVYKSLWSFHREMDSSVALGFPRFSTLLTALNVPVWKHHTPEKYFDRWKFSRNVDNMVEWNCFTRGCSTFQPICKETSRKKRFESIFVVKLKQ